MSEWQPIATAPKDGTRILLYFPHNDVAIGGCWMEVTDGDWESGYKKWHEWVVDNELFFMDDDPAFCYPTHWVPLPAPLKEPER